MSYVNPENLPNDHPLNFKNIQVLQNQIQTLDPNDIFFPIMYHIPEILDSNDKKSLNCHSISALKNYGFLSTEEMRYLNFAKRNSKNILNDEKLIKNITNSKIQYLYNISFNPINKIYYYDLLTEDEKMEINQYINLSKNGVDNTINYFRNNYNHVNFILQQYAFNDNNIKNSNRKNNTNNLLSIINKNTNMINSNLNQSNVNNNINSNSFKLINNFGTNLINSNTNNDNNNLNRNNIFNSVSQNNFHQNNFQSNLINQNMLLPSIKNPSILNSDIILSKN